MNPDGVDLVNGALPPARAEEAADIARLRPDIPFPAGWKANIRGVDLNLQYPALWETARENITALCRALPRTLCAAIRTTDLSAQSCLTLCQIRRGKGC